MEERYIEIQFYYYIKNLIQVFKYNVRVIDLIEVLCTLNNVDTSVIKYLVKQIREGTSTIRTYREELIYIARKLDISYRDLRDLTNISITTQHRVMQQMKKEEHLYEGITKHLNDTMYNEVYKFMKVVELLREV
jgi:hypothetical protein